MLALPLFSSSAISSTIAPPPIAALTMELDKPPLEVPHPNEPITGGPSPQIVLLTVFVNESQSATGSGDDGSR